MKRSATAVWNGTINDGHGHLNTQSGILENAQYSFKSRFGEAKGTNPEELIAAAHAGCFAMKLSMDLTDAGFTPTSIEVISLVEIESGVITSSHLTLTAIVPGLEQEEFATFAKNSKDNCPVSRALSIEIILDAHLE
jgi:osmotically inducible protein OsmC